MKTTKDLRNLTMICTVIIVINITLYIIYPIHGGIVIFSIASLFIIAICIGGWVKAYKQMKAEAAYYEELGTERDYPDEFSM